MGPLATAAKAAGLPAATTAYCLRHSFISRALARGVPVLAVAQHCGTSAEMIEATYAKFTQGAMAEWFA
jgi:integrase